MTTKILKPDPAPGGPISWMARNRVAANLVMFTFLIGGVIMMFRVKQEVFPDFDVDRISVSMPYPGASPEEVEQGILLAIEDEVRGIDGVKEVRSNALEGTGAVSIEIQSGAEPDDVLQDVKNAVDRIQSFPEEAERPIVRLVQPRRQVISIIVYGRLEHGDLRDVADRIRDELLQEEGVTLIELGATRPREIAIEVPQQTLRSLGLTLEQIAAEVRRTAIELPGGEVKTQGGQILLRTMERRDFARQFADIEVVSSAGGTRVTLGQIADIRDTFAETDDEASFMADNVMGGDALSAVRVDVFRVGDQTPIGIVNVVREYVEEVRGELPEGVNLALWDDQSEIYRDRINLLLRNAALGLGLVLLLLGLFLEPRLAFWVMLGIPISIIGSFLLIPLTGATVNMISLFAFIVTLGIIVDDAIMVGENIYEHRERGLPFRKAAIEGARHIAGPVHFAVLTNMFAFMPLFFVPGAAGNLFLQIPAVVVTVFAISLIESLYVLPAHLSHKPGKHVVWTVLGWPSRFFGRGLRFVSHRAYPSIAGFCVRNRYATFAVAAAMLGASVGAVAGGHIQWSWMPRVDADLVTARATLPFGSPVEQSRQVAAMLEQGARQALREHGGERIVKGVYVRIGGTGGGPGGPGGDASGLPGASGAHNVSVQLALAPADQRDVSGVVFARDWRQATPPIAGLESLVFTGSIHTGAAEAINIELTHRSRDVLESAAAELAKTLGNYAGVTDIDDGVELGKPQLSFAIKPEARSLGLTSMDVARQVRSAFYGAEALRQQRGRDEVKVMVRLPEEDRRRMQTVEDLVLRTPTGGEIALREAVETERGRAYTVIRRREGRRVLSVTADVDEQVANANEVVQEVTANELPALKVKYPGLSFSLEGQQRQQRESMTSLLVGFVLALIAIYAMLAIPFKHYVQPLIVMLAIPFGIIGAVLGHYALGYEISMISFFGIIALAGVVVNDSLVLVVTINEQREQGMSAKDAVIAAGSRRFRPILLTSVTTFGGLAPMIFETSMQAKFLIPMAIALGFGILFSTLIILLLVPAVYMILEDIVGALRLIFVAPPEELGLAVPEPAEAEGRDRHRDEPDVGGAAVAPQG